MPFFWRGGGTLIFLSGSLWAGVLLAVYLVINLAYSLGVKAIPIADVAILAAGFLIRVMYGAAITGITVSDWLYLTVLSAAFFFALGKRRNELTQSGGSETRKVLKYYTVNFLDKNMYVTMALTNVFYALWSMDARTVSQYHGRHLVFSVPVVLLIMMKYSLDLEGDSDGDPVEVLLHDKVLIALCLIYAAVIGAMLYL